MRRRGRRSRRAAAAQVQEDRAESDGVGARLAPVDEREVAAVVAVRELARREVALLREPVVQVPPAPEALEPVVRAHDQRVARPHVLLEHLADEAVHLAVGRGDRVRERDVLAAEARPRARRIGLVLRVLPVVELVHHVLDAVGRALDAHEETPAVLRDLLGDQLLAAARVSSMSSRNVRASISLSFIGIVGHAQPTVSNGEGGARELAREPGGWLTGCQKEGPRDRSGGSRRRARTARTAAP